MRNANVSSHVATDTIINGDTMTGKVFEHLAAVFTAIFDKRTEEQRYLESSTDLVELERRLKEIQSGDFQRKFNIF